MLGRYFRASEAEGAGSRSRMFSNDAAALGSRARAKRAGPLALWATVPLITVHPRHKGRAGRAAKYVAIYLERKGESHPGSRTGVSFGLP